MSKIKLPIDKIREFTNLSKYIVTDKSELQPILKYIRIEISFGTCTLIKSNGNSYLRFSFDVDHDDAELLIDQKYINLICEISKEQLITIEVKEGFVHLTDGKFKQKFNCPYSIESFIKLPITNSDTIRFGKDILSSLSIAKLHAGEDKLMPAFMCVYIENDYMYSSDHERIYIKKLKESFPNVALTSQECVILSQYEYIDYSKSENYNTYKYQNIVFGFITPENSTGWDFKQFLPRAKKENYAVINKDDFILFCTSTIGFSSGLFCNSSLSISGNFCQFMFEDKEKSEENILDAVTRSIGTGFSFRFNPNIWLPIMKALPYQEIHLGDEHGCISLWNPSDDSYLGLISKLQ